MDKPDVVTRVKGELDKARTHLDRMRVRAHLFKAEFRDRKDEVMADLEERYEKVSDALKKTASEAGDKAETAGEALSAAWSAFKARLKETQAENADSSS